MQDRYKLMHEVWDRCHDTGSPTYFVRSYLLKKAIRQYIKPYYQVLDLGCGTGEYLKEFSKNHAKIDAVDFSNYAILQAKKNVISENVNFFKANIEKFNPNKKYDLIFCSEVLEHLENDQSILSKIYDWLLQGGILIISVPFDPKLWSKIDVFSGHQRRYTKDDLMKKVENSHFNIINLWCYGFPLLRLYWTILKSFNVSTKKVGEENNKFIKFIIYFIRTLFNLDKILLSTNKGVGLILLAKK